MKSLLATVLLTAVLAAPVSVSAAASGLNWNLSKPVIATCADGSILDTNGHPANGIGGIYEWFRRWKCSTGN